MTVNESMRASPAPVMQPIPMIGGRDADVLAMVGLGPVVVGAVWGKHEA